MDIERSSSYDEDDAYTTEGVLGSMGMLGTESQKSYNAHRFSLVNKKVEIKETDPLYKKIVNNFYFKPLLFWAGWIFFGSLYYSYAMDLGAARGFYMAVNVGYVYIYCMTYTIAHTFSYCILSTIYLYTHIPVYPYTHIP
jgi:hypothetical protein